MDFRITIQIQHIFELLTYQVEYYGIHMYYMLCTRDKP